MQLVADRFVVDDGQTALDLATSQRVALDIASTGSEREQRIWALSCDAAERRHHPAIARLIDYGLVGGIVFGGGVVARGERADSGREDRNLLHETSTPLIMPRRGHQPGPSRASRSGQIGGNSDNLYFCTRDYFETLN